MRKIVCFLALTASLIACGQQQNNNPFQNNKTANTMDFSKITNENVKKAIEALQANDKNAWYSYFTDDAVFTDDGRTMNFKSFFDNAFDKKEKFLTIDKIENNSKDIYGNFYAG
ncbi:MAG: hypothetical protein R2807_02530 [Chitinophagales bacterium]